MRTLVAVSITLGACVGDIQGGRGSDRSPDDGGVDGGIEPGVDGGEPVRGVDAAPGAVDAPPRTADAADPGDIARVCDRWNADRRSMDEGSWSGSVDACQAGDVSAGGRANALRIVNLYRWLADLPPVTTDPARDAKAQACALMMHANDELSHDPPDDWRCRSADGAEAAGRSNIASAPGVSAVDLYMVDPGNPTTMGHRRWILSDGLGPIGLGTTDQFSCMWVIGGSGDDERPWTAWPPPGLFPLGAVKPSFASIDDTGWTIQSRDIDLRGGRVTVTAGGQTLAVATTELAANFGSRFALSFIPDGWTTRAGVTYHVAVTGGSQPIEYDVAVVDCGD